MLPDAVDCAEEEVRVKSPLPLPLEGVRILAIEQLGAGPWGTLQLADLGAEVIKIEDRSLGGDSARQTPPYLDESRPNDSLYFQSFNRNKKAITLNLRANEGQRIFRRLVATADAVFNNLRGDLPRRLGLTYEQLEDVNPKIVCVSCSAYGTAGEWAAEPGYDYLFQGRSGMMALTGEPDTPPTKAALSIVDFTGGALATIGLLVGLHAAGRDGVGRDVEVSLLDSAISLLNYLAIWNLNRGYRATKLPRSQHPSLVPVGVYPSRDGWLVVMCMKDKFFPLLCAALERPDLPRDPRFKDLPARLANRDALNAILDAEFKRLTTDEWMRRLRGRVPCGPVYDLDQALDDPLVAEHDMIWEVDHPDFGRIRQVGCPIKISDGRRAEQTRGPFLGEHTEQVLGDLGFTPADVERLRAAGVV
jgi:crotonobetainyl-CoA:carnitine CoA-transferase CaiB-like acyl-CoA transferase